MKCPSITQVTILFLNFGLAMGCSRPWNNGARPSDDRHMCMSRACLRGLFADDYISGSADTSSATDCLDGIALHLDQDEVEHLMVLIVSLTDAVREGFSRRRWSLCNRESIPRRSLEFCSKVANMSDVARSAMQAIYRTEPFGAEMEVLRAGMQSTVYGGPSCEPSDEADAISAMLEYQLMMSVRDREVVLERDWCIGFRSIVERRVDHREGVVSTPHVRIHGEVSPDESLLQVSQLSDTDPVETEIAWTLVSGPFQAQHRSTKLRRTEGRWVVVGDYPMVRGCTP